ncbi:MAG TPA: dihydrofolate reductase family protein [Thermoanaerobaculia bacterium]|nr:dihydrofolate reductase family protein [Thermoanaerobaculia bacterium]
MTFDLLSAGAVNGALAASPGGVSTAMAAMLGTPPAVLERMYAVRRRYDAVAVGTGTVVIDDPTLTSHLAGGKVVGATGGAGASAGVGGVAGAAAGMGGVAGGGAVRVTLDRTGRIPRQARIFDGSARTLVGVVAATPRPYLDFLAERGVEAVPCGEDRIDLAAFAAALSDRGLKRVVVEGGGRLNRELLRLGLVNRIHLTLLPAALDSRAANLFDGRGEPVRLQLLGCDRLGDYLFLEYQVIGQGRGRDQTNSTPSGCLVSSR